MSSRQSSGTGALTDRKDEMVENDKSLSNRDKAQPDPSFSLDGRGTEVDEYKDNVSNRRVDDLANHRA